MVQASGCVREGQVPLELEHVCRGWPRAVSERGGGFLGSSAVDGAVNSQGVSQQLSWWYRRPQGTIGLDNM